MRVEIDLGKAYPREEIEAMSHVLRTRTDAGTMIEVSVQEFMAGNPAKLVKGLVAKVDNGHGSRDFFAPKGDKFVWAYRN